MVLLLALLGIYALLDIAIGVKALINGNTTEAGVLILLGSAILFLLFGDRIVMRYGSRDRVKNYRELNID